MNMLFKREADEHLKLAYSVEMPKHASLKLKKNDVKFNPGEFKGEATIIGSYIWKF